MLQRIFPKAFDNAYRGHGLALWLLAAVAALKMLQSVNSIIWTRAIMTGADGVPVDSFAPAAAREATALFALLSLSLMVVPVLSAVALIRYRAMVPLLYLMLIALWLGARIVNTLHPEGGVGSEPLGFTINLGILAVTLLGFVLSLRSKAP